MHCSSGLARTAVACMSGGWPRLACKAPVFRWLNCALHAESSISSADMSNMGLEDLAASLHLRTSGDIPSGRCCCQGAVLCTWDAAGLPFPASQQPHTTLQEGTGCCRRAGLVFLQNAGKRTHTAQSGLEPRLKAVSFHC